MRKLTLIIILITFFSCKSQNDASYSSEEICICYSKSNNENLDLKLNSCLTEFNKALNSNYQLLEKKDVNLQMFSNQELNKLVKELIQNCPNYQKDFNSILFNKYSKDFRGLVKQKDSITDLVNRKVSEDKNLGVLAEIEILEKNYDKSFELINKSIKLNPDIEYSYWIRAYLNHQKKDFNKAILDFEKARELTIGAENKMALGLFIENLKIEKNKFLKK